MVFKYLEKTYFGASATYFCSQQRLAMTRRQEQGWEYEVGLKSRGVLLLAGSL